MNKKKTGFLLAILVLLVCSNVWFAMQTVSPTLPLTDTRTVVTAAHLKEEMVGYHQVYIDEGEDYAVFVADAYTPIIAPEVGDTVYLCGTSGVVNGRSDTSFSVDVENTSMIIPGVSGTLVRYNDTYVGFVSGWDGSGNLKCIFF